MPILPAGGQDTYLTKRQVQWQLANMVRADGTRPEGFPAKGEEVRVEVADGSSVTYSLTDLRGTYGDRLYLCSYRPAPGAMVEIEGPDTPPPFDGIVRCSVRGRPGYAFRTADGDPMGRILFVPDETRRGFDRGELAWFGGISSQAWSLVTDISPATDDDMASCERWMERRRIGRRPEAPPLDPAFVEDFVAQLPFLMETGLGYNIEHGSTASQYDADLLVEVAKRSGDPDAMRIAAGFDDLWPVRRCELVALAHEAYRERAAPGLR